MDRWRWLLDPVLGYTVKGAYHLLTSVEEPLARGLFDDVWHKHVPLKVSLFAWRLLRNRLPTQDNLVRRRVLHHNDNECVGGCGLQETATHLFLNCDTFCNMWVSVSHWLNIHFVAPEVLRAHLLQFGHLEGLPRFTYSFLKLIWLACVWVIWREMNNHVFNQKASELQQMTDRVKMLSFRWLKACMSTCSFKWRHPLLCMRVLQ